MPSVGWARRGALAIPDALGTRIRKARLELGLSLAQVAGTEFSRSFLNQVELGRARPSTRTLQVISDRLHRPLEFFLLDPKDSTTVVELLLAEAGTRLRQGDAAQARALAAELAARRNLPPETRTRAQLLLAEALLRLNEVNAAMPILRAAIRTSEEAGWSALAVELYDRMGSAYYLLRQPHEAGRWWDRALSTYEEATLADPLLKARILGHLANLHYVAGQPREAIAGYQAAIASAGAVLDMQALGGIYEGLAVAFQRTGQVERALEYAQRSLRLFETLGDVRMSAQLRNNMAKILLEEGKAEQAERVFLEGADQLRRVDEKDLLPLLLAGAAEAALDEGQLSTAEARLAEALAAVPNSRDPLAQLTAARIGGRIAQAGHQPGQARSHFEAALEIATALDSRMERSKVLYDYAQVLEVQGDAVGAIARYREAYEAQRVANSA